MLGLSESRNYLGSGNPLQQWSADLGPGILDIKDDTNLERTLFMATMGTYRIYI